MVFSTDCSLLLKDSNASINANKGAHTNGWAYPLEQKLFVASVHDRLCCKSGKRPMLLAVAKEAGTSVGFVSKAVEKLDCFGTVLEPSSKHAGARGVGSKSLSLEDQQILSELLNWNPFRTRQNCVNWLAEIAGTQVSESTISRSFCKVSPFAVVSGNQI